MKTIKFDKRLEIYIIEDDEIGAIINLTQAELNEMIIEANVERIMNSTHLL